MVNVVNQTEKHETPLSEPAMCSVCGDTGYKPAMRYGVGTSTANVLWASYAVMEPCDICQPMWRFGWNAPQPVIVPIPQK